MNASAPCESSDGSAAASDRSGQLAVARLVEALQGPTPLTLRQPGSGCVEQGAAAAPTLRVTNRGRERAQWQSAGMGVRLRDLYAAPLQQRAGEPQTVQLIEMEAGARWTPAAVDSLNQVEWLVLQGALRLEANMPVELRALDFHVQAALSRLPTVLALSAVRFYLRHAPRLTATTATSREAPEHWQELVPGLLTRQLWRGGDEAAYLVRAEPGSQVPEHGHGHDEECLMIEGELLLDDTVLRAGDWQLAPKGSRHARHVTQTGLLLLVRGDAQMPFDAPAG